MVAIRKFVSNSSAADSSATSVSRAAIRSSKSDIELLHRGVCAADGKGGAKVWEEKSSRLGPCRFPQNTLQFGLRHFRLLDRRMARFEDSPLGMAIGATVTFAMLIGILHLGGGQ